MIVNDTIDPININKNKLLITMMSYIMNDYETDLIR